MQSSQRRGFVLFFAFLSVLFSACVKDDPATLVVPPVPDQSFVEEFDTVASAFHRGWVPINNSNPKGLSIWTQGGGLQPIFAPYSSQGTFAGFIAADYLSTSGAAEVISNWLISPKVIMQNGDKIVFYTRSQVYSLGNGDSTDFGNNLEVCVNFKNDSTNVGTALNPRDPDFNVKTDRGDFEAIFTINPPVYNAATDFYDYRYSHTAPNLYDPLAYPSRWTRFEVTIGGLNAPHKGRFAFRYYTLDAGSNGNGSAVAIDSVAYIGKK